MKNEYADILGMEFPYLSVSGHGFECFVAAVDGDVGMTIKTTDIELLEKFGYEAGRGTKDEGNMTCIDLKKFPDRIDYFIAYVEELREIRNSNGLYFNPKLLDSSAGRGSGGGGLPICAF